MDLPRPIVPDRADHDPSADRARGRSARVRLLRWPGSSGVGHLVVVDQHTVPTDDEVRDAIRAATIRGDRVLRTGALFPRAAEVIASHGFTVVDTLALLEVDLDDVVLDRSAAARARRATRRMHSWHHADAAVVDRAAFGIDWSNDAVGLDEIRRATPAHRARRLDVDGELRAFAISGAAARTGYLQRLAVHPEVQRSGLGRTLVLDSLHWMQRRGLRAALVNTGVDNAAALALYAGVGFHLLPDRLTICELALPGRAAG